MSRLFVAILRSVQNIHHVYTIYVLLMNVLNAKDLRDENKSSLIQAMSYVALEPSACM